MDKVIYNGTVYAILPLEKYYSQIANIGKVAMPFYNKGEFVCSLTWLATENRLNYVDTPFHFTQNLYFNQAGHLLVCFPSIHNVPFYGRQYSAFYDFNKNNIAFLRREFVNDLEKAPNGFSHIV